MSKLRSFQLLIDLYEKNIQEKKQEKASLEQRIAELEQDIQTQYAQIEKEKQVSTHSPQLAVAYTDYACRLYELIEQLQKAMAKLKEQVQVIDNEIIEQFIELKKMQKYTQN